MMRRNSLRTAARSLAPVLLLALFAGAAVADTALEQGQRALRLAARIDSSRFVERIRSLSTSYPSRMIGSDGDSAAAMYVANAFRSIGLKSVQIQEFETVVAKDFLSRIIIPSSGDTINLHAFPPNFARTNTVLPGGIAGKLVYGGQARPANLNGQDIENSIVLMEMNTGRRWTTIATLGAQAALFIEPADPYERELFKGFATSVNFPRFWIERDGGRRLKEHLAENPGTQVVVEAYQPWQTAKGRNVIGYLNGSDPVLLQETVIITAGIDGYSTISTLAPAAEQAGGIAALLELAEIFSKSPPARSVMFVGLDGGGANTGLVGARTLVQALKQNYPGTLALFIQQFREDVRLIGDRKLAAKFPEYREATDALETALEDIVDGSQSDAVDDWRALVLARTAYVTESKATLERQGEELEQARSIYGQAVARAARIFISSFRTVTDELAPLIERFDDLHQQYLVLLHRDVSQLQPIVDADADKIRTDVRGRLAAARLSDVKRALKTLEAIGGDDYRRRLKNTLDGFELVEPLLPKQIALMAHLKLKSHQDGIGVFYKGFFFNQIPDLELKRAFGDIGKRFTSYAANAVINSNLERLWALSDSKIRGGISQEREALIRRKADYEQLVGIENTETTQTYVWYHSAFNAVTWPLALILLLVSGWFVRRVLKDGGQLSPRLIVGLALGLLLVVLKIAGWRWHGTATVDLAIDTLIENYSELLLDADELPRDNKSKIRLIKEKGASYLDIVQTPTYFADNIRHAISKTVTVVTDEITAADAELARINEQLELRDTPVAALSDSQLIRLQRLIVKLEVGEPERFIDGVAGTKGKAWSHYLPSGAAFPSEVGTMGGIPSIALATTDDATTLIGSPFDRFEALELGNLLTQTRTLIAVLSQGLNDPSLPDDFVLGNYLAEIWGQTLVEDRTGGTLAGVPVDSVLIIVDRGMRRQVTMSDKRGQFHLYGMGLDGRTSTRNASDYWIHTYKLSPDSGHIRFALDVGSELYSFEPTVAQRAQNMSFVIFPCASISVTDLIDHRYFAFLPKGDVYDARTNGLPRNYSVHMAVASSMSFFANAGLRVKFKFAQGLLGTRMALTGVPDIINEPKDREGIGFPVQAETLITHSAARAAWDMWQLDEGRLLSLIKHGIVDDDTRAIHDSAKVHLDKAFAHLDDLTYDGYLTEARTALALESSVLPQVLSTASGTLKGVLFYMSLLLPFAFFAERLFIGSVDVRRQALGFFGLFILMFLLIQAIHPAFDIVSAPPMVLVAFTVFALSLFVGGIIISKFSAQMKDIRRSQGVIQTDIGRLSAMITAFLLGVSNLRKRKMRTALTCGTLVLLTFTVLSFTSVSEYLRVNRIQLTEEKATYPGILIRDRYWVGWPRDMLEAIQNELGNEQIVAGRAWREAFVFGADFFFQLEGPTGEEATVSGMVGMEPYEKEVTNIDRALVAGRWFNEEDRRAIVLPQSLAATMSVSEQDVEAADPPPVVRFQGTEYFVVGVLGDEAIRAILDLDGEELTSVNWQVADQTRKTSRQMGASDAGAAQPGQRDSYVHLAPGRCVFLPLNQVRGNVVSIAIRVKDQSEAIPLIERLIPKWAMEVFVGNDEGTFLYSAVGLTSLGGLGDVMIPVVIAALIILNTMLGAVFERTREIGIFSAVGLAPSHIAMLFMAEACVYAVLGAISGYMIGQLVGKTIADLGIMGGVTLNYSSLSAVASTTIVMATVLLSTIYPAKRASEIAVPDIARTWKLPPADGDEWYFALPFTLMDDELEGLNSFIASYFEAHHEESSSDFYIDEIDFWADEGRFMLETMVWLAPYDLGVSELVTIITSPVPNEDGLFAMSLLVTRVSGDVPSWNRVNRRFVNFLRKQLLIWRTLSMDERMTFAEKGRRTFRADGDVLADGATTETESAHA